MSDGKVYEMLWDCQYCGSEKLLGLTHRYCPNCGAAQNPDARYFPSDEEKIAVEDHVYHGVDVTCAKCGELNSAKAEFCGQCGGALTDAARAKTLLEQERAAGEMFQSSGSRDLVKEQFEADLGISQPQEKKKRGGLRIPLIVGGVVALIVAVVFLLTWTKETTLTATGHEWERMISIEEYSNFTVQSWDDSRPSGDNVRMGSCTRQQRSTRQIADGQECRTVRTDQGDGTFREQERCTTKYRSEPVYDDMCTWSGQRWEDSTPIVTTGGLNNAPYWGETNLNCVGQSRIGCQREAGRSEEYRVVFTGTEDNTIYQCPFPQEEWSAIQVQSRWVGRVHVIAESALDCDTLQPAN